MMAMQPCGFCRGRGLAPAPTCDRHGWPQSGPAERVCEYCGGDGEIEEGDKLEAATPRLVAPQPYQHGPYY